MGDLIAAMNRASEADTPDQPRTINENFVDEPGAAIPTNFASGDPKAAAMGDILRRFYSITENLTEAAETHTGLKEALTTYETPAGVVVGGWRIEKDERRFSVVNTTTDQAIAYDLVLYEAALALARCLNEGKSVTHRDFKEILRLEEDYNKHLREALIYKKTFQTSTGQKQMIAEARSSDAKMKCISAKMELKKFSQR
jgi:hypothetical protein